MQENERERVGGNVRPNVHSVLTFDGQEMQREENDTLITDNKKLRIHCWRRLDANDQFGGPECRSGDTPSFSARTKKGVNVKEEKKKNKIL